ncbi:MAG: glutamine--tRNA ligase/YqeY domain fusion protein [Verrucomicrobia subdivision 3 bacterium]|nr:glutamine--tRNA ligase/YqeY domain fusion protein [Limisphaerales bacterium]
MNNAEGREPLKDFIRDRVVADVASGTYPGVVTRFPPEPNGYLHLGHAKSICLNFGIALENNGVCNLRFDDTNPAKEDTEFVESISEDVRWLIEGWADSVISKETFFASSYFEQLHEYAVQLIRDGNAYVCDLSLEEWESYRGAPEQPGKESPHRNRSVEENLDLFSRMRAGEFADGEKTLRAKIDMASPNLHLRDPVIYRIRHEAHHQAGEAWCIYPMYDFTHCLSDSIEGISHSICTLEFEVHRPLYDWVLDQLPVPQPRPHQHEFSRLNPTYMVMSKRKLRQLVEENHVNGWDDPRMPTLAGYRRRGFTAASIRNFCQGVGVTKFKGVTDVGLLENAIREELNKSAERRCAVLDPLEVLIDNYPEGESEELEAVNNPEDESAGKRALPFGRRLFIERADFMEDPPKKFFRLGLGREVRLRYAYFITCQSVEKDAAGNTLRIHCTYDPETRGGSAPDGRKVKGTLHWVSADHAVDAEVRLYDRLFTEAEPEAEGNFLDCLNPDSLKTITAKLEPSLAEFSAGQRVQFERLGYFTPDPKDSAPNQPVFNRIVALRDSWVRQSKN